MKKFRDDMSALANVTKDIRKLGGVVAGVAAATGAGAGRPIINVDGGGVDSQPNPAKKCRVKAPIPSNAEIVEIEKKVFLVCVPDRTVVCITEVIRVIHVARTK
jgi:hypothetical protein